MMERPQGSKPFLKREGSEARQQFGQRICGPPSDWAGPAPPRGSEVFIGNLPRDLYEDELIPVMEVAGVVYLARIMMDFTGATRGYAFVTYADPEAAHRATTSLNRLEIRPGRFIGVYHSFDNRRLFLGNIPKTSTRDEVMRQVKMHTEGVLDVTVHGNHKDPKKNRGYAFVRYETHRAATIARRKLLEINGHLSKAYPRVTVDWAEPEVEDMKAALHDVSSGRFSFVCLLGGVCRGLCVSVG